MIQKRWRTLQWRELKKVARAQHYLLLWHPLLFTLCIVIIHPCSLKHSYDSPLFCPICNLPM